MLSSDRNVVLPESAVAKRMVEYGSLVEELHVVLLSDSNHKLKDTQLARNVWIYPTNSFTKFLRPIDAVRIGRKVVFDKKFVRGESLITAQDPFECGWAAVKIKKRWRLPLEVQLHTDPFSSYFVGFLNKIRRAIARTVLAKADSIRVVSENVKSQIMNRKLNLNVNVLPIYVDKEEIEKSHVTFDLHARYPWKFILLTVSRLTPEKNLALSLRILKLVHQRYPNTGLVIVGSGPEEKKLKRLVRNFGLRDKVVFAGWQSDLVSYYKTADVFLQTSFFEGYGMALIEAGLSGLPVVTTPVGIAKQLEHGKDALIFDIQHPELFADGIIDLIEHNHKRESLQINMKHFLESKLLTKEEYLKQMKLNWEKIVFKSRTN